MFRRSRLAYRTSSGTLRFRAGQFISKTRHHVNDQRPLLEEMEQILLFVVFILQRRFFRWRSSVLKLKPRLWKTRCAAFIHQLEHRTLLVKQMRCSDVYLRHDGQRFLVNTEATQISSVFHGSVQLGREPTRKELAVDGLGRVAQLPVFSRHVPEQ